MGSLWVFRYSLATVVLAVATMGLGSYVSKVGAGLACPEWPLCPLESDPFIVLEFSHRTVALATFLSGLAAFVAARKSPNFVGKSLVYIGFGALTLQVFIVGAVVIFTALPAVVVAMHQVVASLVVALYAAAATASYLSNVCGEHV